MTKSKLEVEKMITSEEFGATLTALLAIKKSTAKPAPIVDTEAHNTKVRSTFREGERYTIDDVAVHDARTFISNGRLKGLVVFRTVDDVFIPWFTTAKTANRYMNMRAEHGVLHFSVKAIKPGVLHEIYRNEYLLEVHATRAVMTVR